MTNKKSRKTKIVNPAASDSSLTKSPMPYSSVPFTVYNSQPVQPMTTPKLRQLVESENVRIINPKAGL